MKIKYLFILAALFLMLHPQRQRKIIRIGCIDIQRVISKVASDRLLNRILENKKSDFLQKAEELSKEIQQLKDILAKEGDTLPKERVESYEEEIILKQEQLKAYLNEKKMLLDKVENDLSVQVLKSIYEYIKKIAIKGGYSLIIEKGTSVIYAEEEVDVTDDVLKLLEEEKTPYISK